MADEHGIPLQNAAGTLAAMSPNTAWDQNVAMSQRIATILKEQGDTVMSPEMIQWGQDYATKYADVPGGQKMLDVIAKHAPFRTSFGTPLNQIDDPLEAAHFVRMFDEAHGAGKDTPLLTPEGDTQGFLRTKDNPDGTPGAPVQASLGVMPRTANAIQAYRAPDMPTVSQAMGNQHKVRNFYNNIVAPNSDKGDVTIDTHAIAAGLLRPLGGKDDLVAKGLGSSGSSNSATGALGLYAPYADAYRAAAADRGILPRQMQSVTWEALRGLYTPAMKNSKTNQGQEVLNTVNNLWSSHANGELTQPEVQQRIIGGYGIQPPRWMSGAPAAEDEE
jgi:hypothetical protein